MNTQFSLAKKSTVVGVVLSILSIACIVMFSFQYYFEKELNFSHENKFILFLVVALFLLVFIFTIYFAVLVNYMIKRINLQQNKIQSIYSIVNEYKTDFAKIDDDMANVEDNLVEVIRDTQGLIIELKKEMGVVKCSETRTPIEVKSGEVEIP